MLLDKNHQKRLGRELRKLSLAGFALVTLASWAGAAEEVLARLNPVGAMVRELPAGMSGLAFPLIEEEAFGGRIIANSGAGIVLGETPALEAGGRYYVEILDGALEGERLDVNVAATVAAGNGTVVLDLSEASLSTIRVLGEDVLKDACCAVRRHVTLGRIGEMISPGLVGNNNAARADGIHVFGKSGFIFYYLRGDGKTWRRASSPEDMSGMMIPPGSSVLVELRSGAKQWTHLGEVRSNAFRRKLEGDLQAFSTGFPVDMSPVEIGGFSGSGAVGGAADWEGSDNYDLADKVLVFDAASGDYASWYLSGDGEKWLKKGGGGEGQSLVPFLKAGELMLLQRGNADEGYVIPSPVEL